MRCLIACVLSLIAAGVAQHVHYEIGTGAFLLAAAVFLLAAADGGWNDKT